MIDYAAVSKAALEYLERPNDKAAMKRYIDALNVVGNKHPYFCSDVTLHILDEPATLRDLEVFKDALRFETGIPRHEESYVRIMETPYIKLTSCPYKLSQIFSDQWETYVPHSVNTILHWTQDNPITSPALIEECIAAVAYDERNKPKYPVVASSELGAFLLAAVDKRLFTVIW